MERLQLGWSVALKTVVDDLGSDSDTKSRRYKTGRKIDTMVERLAQDPSVHNNEWMTVACRLNIGGKRVLPILESRSWVPEAMRAVGIVSEDFDGLGSGWLLRSEPCNIRVTNGGWSFDHLGRFIFGLTNNMIAIMWPSEKILELGTPASSVMDFIETITVAEWKGWKNNVVHCPLQTGGIVWVPYGYQCALVSFGDIRPPKREPTWTYTFHVVSKKLYQNLDDATRDMISRQQL